MKTNHSKFVLAASMLALLGAGCFSSEPPVVDTKPVTPPAVKPADAVPTPSDTTLKPTTETPAPTPAPDTTMSPDRVVDTKELPVIDGTWKTYNNTALNFSFLYPTKGRFAPEWSVKFMLSTDATLSGGCVNPQAEKRTADGSIVVGDSTFCVVREVEAGAGQRFYTDTYTVPRSERIVQITFTKRLANGDIFEDESCHGKTVISSGTSCILFDEALYRAHLNQIIGTYRHE